MDGSVSKSSPPTNEGAVISPKGSAQHGLKLSFPQSNEPEDDFWSVTEWTVPDKNLPGDEMVDGSAKESFQHEIELPIDKHLFDDKAKDTTASIIMSTAESNMLDNILTDDKLVSISSRDLTRPGLESKFLLAASSDDEDNFENMSYNSKSISKATTNNLLHDDGAAGGSINSSIEYQAPIHNRLESNCPRSAPADKNLFGTADTEPEGFLQKRSRSKQGEALSDDRVVTADSKDGYIQRWLKVSSSKPAKKDGQLPGDKDSDGLATQIYSASLKALRNLYSQERTLSLDKPQLFLLKEELAKLYMWGEIFSPGEIDLALEYSDDARTFILDTFEGIGRLLLRAVSICSTASAYFFVSYFNIKTDVNRKSADQYVVKKSQLF